MKDKEFTIGITKDNLLIKATLDLNDCNKKHYWYKNTNSYRGALTEEEGEQRAKEYLNDDTEIWKIAVEGDHTTLGFDDWAEDVLNMDGFQQVLDVIEFGNYWLEWDTIGGWEKYQKATYQKLYITKADFKKFFRKQKDIIVGSKEEKEYLELFDKYSDQDEDQISEDFKEVV